jgi:hypothetical protein
LLRPPLPVLSVCAGSVDVRVLYTLVASTKQQDDLRSSDSVIDSESRSNIDSQFPHPIATKPVIAEVAQFNAVDSAINGVLCFCVTKFATPFHEDVFLAPRKIVQNLVHRSMIVYKRIIVNNNSYLIDSEFDFNVYFTRKRPPESGLSFSSA